MLGRAELEEEIRILERRELEGGGTESSLGTDGYASLMALTLLQDYRIENVRSIWRRIPAALKNQQPSVLTELWSLSVLLSTRDLPAFYAAAANFAWPPSIAAVIRSLVERVRQEQIVLVGSSYASVGVEALGSLLGLDQQGVIDLVSRQPGWNFEPETMLVTPYELPPSSSSSTFFTTRGGGAGDDSFDYDYDDEDGEPHLPNLTSYVSFLEN